MKYFESGELAGAILGFVFLGVTGGVAYRLVFVIAEVVKNFLLFPFLLAECYSKSHYAYLKNNLWERLMHNEDDRIAKESVSAFFLLAFGVIFVLTNYVLMDSVFRIYNVVLVTASFALSAFLFRKVAEEILSSIIRKTFSFIMLLIFFVSKPFFLLLKTVFRKN